MHAILPGRKYRYYYVLHQVGCGWFNGETPIAPKNYLSNTRVLLMQSLGASFAPVAPRGQAHIH